MTKSFIMALAIAIFLFPAKAAFCQSDSLQLVNSIDKLLKKSGYSNAQFELRIVSNKPGAKVPAFSVSNYKNEAAGKGGMQQRHLSIDVLYTILSQLHSSSTPIKFLISGGKEAEDFGNEIFRELTKRGYKNISGTHWMYPDGFDKVETKWQDGALTIMVCPATETKE